MFKKICNIFRLLCLWWASIISFLVSFVVFFVDEARWHARVSSVHLSIYLVLVSVLKIYTIYVTMHFFTNFWDNKHLHIKQMKNQRIFFVTGRFLRKISYIAYRHCIGGNVNGRKFLQFRDQMLLKYISSPGQILGWQFLNSIWSILISEEEIFNLKSFNLRYWRKRSPASWVMGSVMNKSAYWEL